MQAPESEKIILTLFISHTHQVGIRRARYRELWRYVRQLTFAKELLGVDGDKGPQELKPEQADEDVRRPFRGGIVSALFCLFFLQK